MYCALILADGPTLALRTRRAYGVRESNPSMDLRILVVDSDGRTLEELTTQLHGGGWLVIPVRTFDQAVECFQREGAGLVLLGSNLEGASAELAVLKLRSLSRSTPIVVALEAAGYVSQRARVAEAGAELVLPTPIDGPLLLACVRNLLRTKGLADDLRQRNHEIEGVRREHRMLIDATVHDLKNPLAVVLANVGWALDYLSSSDVEVCEALQDAQEGVHRIQATLDDLSMVLKLEKSEMPLRRESIRVSELVRAVVTSRAPEAQARNVSVTADIDERLEYCGDPTVLRRVVDSMVENSIRYAPSSGKIELSARGQSGLEIEVTNTGVVVPHSERRIPLNDAGDPEDADVAESGETTTTPSLSLALRLYVCRKAVEAFNGRLELIESPEARRSLVVRLPDVGT
jgi:signal transduction histidine kinase